jgi:hypothetical protein
VQISGVQSHWYIAEFKKYERTGIVNIVSSGNGFLEGAFSGGDVVVESLIGG